LNFSLSGTIDFSVIAALEHSKARHASCRTTILLATTTQSMIPHFPTRVNPTRIRSKPVQQLHPDSISLPVKCDFCSCRVDCKHFWPLMHLIDASHKRRPFFLFQSSAVIILHTHRFYGPQSPTPIFKSGIFLFLVQETIYRLMLICGCVWSATSFSRLVTVHFNLTNWLIIEVKYWVGFSSSSKQIQFPSCPCRVKVSYSIGA
jgi:hypothetical protein